MRGPTVGMEEEFFLVDDRTLAPIEELPSAIADRLSEELGTSFELEFFACQGELRTGYSTDLSKVEPEFLSNRRRVAETLKTFGISTLHCGTHPGADWYDRKNKLPHVRTPDLFTQNGRRLLTCGFHVHIGCGSMRRRILLLNLLRPLTPLLLAFSSSSPFWRGQDAGLQSYRISVFSSVRTGGLPPYLTPRRFRSFLCALAENRLGNELVQPHWLIRPSVRFPTVEVRVMDTCPNPRHAIAIAALLQCIADFAQTRARPSIWRERVVLRGPSHQTLRNLMLQTDSLCIRENLWRAQKDGFQAHAFVEHSGRLQAEPLSTIAAELLTELAPYFRRRRYQKHLAVLLEIVDQGPTSVRQTKAAADHLPEGEKWRSAAEVVLRESALA